jgi:hypothetical protein
MTQAIRDQFAEITKRAMQQFVSERVSDRLKTALATETQGIAASRATAELQPPDAASTVTTEEEKEGYNIVRAILSEVVDPRRVSLRDQQSYCSVLLDNSNRKTICRLWFNGSRKYMGLFDENKTERRIVLGDLAEIFRHASDLKEGTKRYLGGQIQGPGESEQHSGGEVEPPVLGTAADIAS